jgi:cysteine-rich repeat protein
MTRRSSILLLVLVSACFDRQSTVCGDGTICAFGRVCVAELELCADPDQLDACDGRADGAPCATPDIPVGACNAGVCLASGCGNGVPEEGEACDDGNTSAGDGCSADCLSNEQCGNAFVDADEECDCGTVQDLNPDCNGPNDNSGGLCRLDCKLHCGDGVISEGEGCDPGFGAAVSCLGDEFDRGTTGCSSSCQPIISIDTCKYIGFRTRQPQIAGQMLLDLAPVGPAHGFFVSEIGAGRFDAFVGIPADHFEFTGLAAVWAADFDNAFAVGSGGSLLRWTAAGWGPISSPTAVDLHDIWGRSFTDVYAVGDDSTVLHWDGDDWQVVPVPAIGPLRALAGDADHVYAASDDGKLLVLDDGGWRVEDTGTTADLRGVFPAGGLVVAVGDGGVIREHDGTGWAGGRTTSTEDLRAVWGSPYDGFWAVGDQGTVLFHDGRVWRRVALGRGVTGPHSQDFFNVGGQPGGTIGIIGTGEAATYEGAAWALTPVPTAETLYGLWGSAVDDVYAVGRNGTILHHDGLTWTVQDSDTTIDLHAVDGDGAGNVYAAGKELTLLAGGGGSWTTLRSGPLGAATHAFLGVHAAPGVVLAVGPDGIFRWDGAELTVDSPTPAVGIWGSSATQAFAVGDRLQRLSVSGWADTGAVFIGRLRAVTGSSGTDAFAVGDINSVHTNLAGNWVQGPFNDDGLLAVAGVQGMDPTLTSVFAAGGNGLLRHWNSAIVEPLQARTTSHLRALYAVDHLVFMAGEDGTLATLIFHR